MERATPPTGDTLADWSDWWIGTRCRCKTAFLPCRMLAQDWRPERRVRDIVARLRCRDCGERPREARMLDDPRGADEVSARVYGPARYAPVP